MRNFSFNIAARRAVFDEPFEIVERKGAGHPDYICDAVMESISIELSREYIKRFGSVLHHNIDKGLLSAGSVKKRFGGGSVTEPMTLTVGDRAAFGVKGRRVAVKDIVVKAARRWFTENLRFVDALKHLEVRVELRPGSEELTSIFAAKEAILGANDTSAAVGTAPFTPTERAVFLVERFLNGAAFKAAFPHTGEDVKVMGVRDGKSLDLTIAMPLVARYVKNERDYFQKKAAVLAALKSFTAALPFKKVGVSLNTLDRKGSGIEGVYLTLLGTSAEDADSGQVGRGNRVNGVISLNRPSGSEAAAGKNPVSHVGKIYSVLSHKMAHVIYESVDGAAEVYVWLLSSIGTPINEPKRLAVEIVPKGRGFSRTAARKKAEKICSDSMADIRAFTHALIRGEYPVC
ncbi:MAG: methionine adenosyltransferase [Deltaproteobacteria bacterium]|nr:methionine adenosyltransferase [Deltaproteobacteria bacterium]